MEQPIVLGLVRGAGGLSAWLSDASGTADGPALRRMALADVPATVYPQRDALLADWHCVQAARELDTAWPALWRVFRATLSETGDAATPMPQRITPAPAPKATAAHPRAFRGTKFQPPKAPAPVLDLAAWLADDRLFDGFLARHDHTRLPIPGADGAPPAYGGGAHPVPTVAGLMAHDAAQWPALPDHFRRMFLWRLRARPLTDLLAWLRVWRGLGSAAQGPALALPATLCALAPHAHAWAALALTLAPPRQVAFLMAVLKQRAYLLAPGALAERQLAEIDALDADDACFAAYLNAVLGNLRRKVSVTYTLKGCVVATRRTRASRPDELTSRLAVDKECADFCVSDIARMHAVLGSDGDYWLVHLWEKCASTPGLAHLLRDTCWDKLSARVADTWLSIFTRTVWYGDDQTEKQNDKRWRAHRAIFPAWHADLVALSGPWQEKYARMARDYASGWDDGDTLRDSLAYLAPLQRRLCSAPFSAAIDIGHPLSCLAVSLPPQGWRQLAAAGERTWLTVERACRRDDHSTLIGRGLFSLAQCWPAFTMHSFDAAPAGLMRVARLLGCLAWQRRRQFLAETGHEVWFSTRWSELAPYDACQMLVRLCIDAGINSPVPRRLREHFEGSAGLSEAQIARHCRLALTRLPHVLLAALEQAVLRRIDTPFKLHDRSGPARHAVRLAAGIDTNRKGLRRFLRQQGEGDAGAYLDHPLNRAWFARHPRIDAAAWQGSDVHLEVDGMTGVQLALATDPFDVLMLGTHVGSCLGLGGLCDYSAVACLLDANKQVVYARDRSGRVLARQLLAIDERDRLVCFQVYPANAGAALLRAFHAFGEAMTASLGIEVYRYDDDDPYHVAIVLAEDWWDDGAWQDRERYAPELQVGISGGSSPPASA